MKKVIWSAMLSSLCALGFSENLRFKQFGTHIPARLDLEVRWNVPPKDTLPSQIWVYRLLPRRLSPETTSYLMKLCSFMENDRVKSSADGILFKTPDNSRHLWISLDSGAVDYETVTDYRTAYLVKDVPNEQQARALVKSLLPKLGIDVDNIDRSADGKEPRLKCLRSQVTYFAGHDAITNTFARLVDFQRAADGISFIGTGAGGNAEIGFGDHGKITKVDLSWRDLERVKAWRTLSPAEIIDGLRHGKAVQGYLAMNSKLIDWRTAKSVTINRVKAYYYAGGSMQLVSDWLEPFACLESDVDTRNGVVSVEIDCPIIDDP